MVDEYLKKTPKIVRGLGLSRLELQLLIRDFQ